MTCHRPALFVAAALLSPLLSGCGGGGGSPSPSQAFAVVLEVDGTGDARALQIRYRAPGLPEETLTNPGLPFTRALSVLDGETVEASVDGVAVTGGLSIVLRDDPNVVAAPQVYASDVCGPNDPDCALLIRHRF